MNLLLALPCSSNLRFWELAGDSNPQPAVYKIDAVHPTWYRGDP
jgi:hypothetical protein